MISMSSLLSLNDPYGSREFDYDHSSGKNFKRNTGKRLSLRSGKLHFISSSYVLLAYIAYVFQIECTLQIVIGPVFYREFPLHRTQFKQ